MVLRPAPTPVTMPLVLPIVTVLLLLLHVPLPASVSVMLCAIHNVDGPLIDEGVAVTDNILVAVHPVGSV